MEDSGDEEQASISDKGSPDNQQEQKRLKRKRQKRG